MKNQTTSIPPKPENDRSKPAENSDEILVSRETAETISAIAKKADMSEKDFVTALISLEYDKVFGKNGKSSSHAEVGKPSSKSRPLGFEKYSNSVNQSIRFTDIQSIIFECNAILGKLEPDPADLTGNECIDLNISLPTRDWWRLMELAMDFRRPPETLIAYFISDGIRNALLNLNKVSGRELIDACDRAATNHINGTAA